MIGQPFCGLKRGKETKLLKTCAKNNTLQSDTADKVFKFATICGPLAYTFQFTSRN